MAAAYVFIQIIAIDPRTVLTALRELSGVKQAHGLLGPTDCIAYIEGEDQDALLETVLAIRAIKGIANTDTRYVYA